MNSAVVVAHPDDETLWAGGLIANNPGIDVICCTVPRRDPIRAIRFFDAVKVLGGYPILIPFQEPEPNQLIPHLEALNLGTYDAVVTHNAEGEYGHLHHQQVSEYVKANFDGPVYCFGPGEIELTLDNGLGEKKRSALKCYDNKSECDGGLTKYEALLSKYAIDFERESYQGESGLSAIRF